jgi:hypothetical protein
MNAEDVVEIPFEFNPLSSASIRGDSVIQFFTIGYNLPHGCRPRDYA